MINGFLHFFQRRQKILAEGELAEPEFLALHDRQRSGQHLHSQLDSHGPLKGQGPQQPLYQTPPARVDPLPTAGL